MWNFTVCSLLVPKIDGIEHLFESKETTEESQQLEEVKADDTFIGEQLSFLIQF